MIVIMTAEESKAETIKNIENNLVFKAIQMQRNGGKFELTIPAEKVLGTDIQYLQVLKYKIEVLKLVESTRLRFDHYKITWI